MGSGVPGKLGPRSRFLGQEEMIMATHEELLREVGELAHYNEKTYFG
jgi:hypothetical protein